MYAYPSVEIDPAREPMIKAPKGLIIKSATAPTATPKLNIQLYEMIYHFKNASKKLPPAKVAFWICTMESLLSALTKADSMNVNTREPVRERRVFTTALCWSSPAAIALKSLKL